jgi:hypothetical protein
MDSDCLAARRPSPARPGWVLLWLCALLAISEAARAQLPEMGEPFLLQATLQELLGAEEASAFENVIPAQAPMRWVAYLPISQSRRTPGVFLYLSPTDSGGLPSRWQDVMDRYHLVYLAAENAGNRQPASRRALLALMGLRALRARQTFDPGRIVIAGFSGGGRVASMMAVTYPRLFAGAVYMCGVDGWKKDQTPPLEDLADRRFVFLTGSRDFNRSETTAAYRRYLEAGARFSKLIVVPGLAHEVPGEAALSEALSFIAEP